MYKYLSIFCFLFSISAFASGDLKETDEFKGEWTATFTLKDGSQVIHTPKGIAMGGISAGKGIRMDASKFNSMRLKSPLDLKTNSTKEDFIASLKENGALG
tara:strand:- start:833 stop:1135 length:303 start_codon:yes stop_codon:yes gene_type:complete